MSQRVRLSGVKQDALGTTYKLTRLDSEDKVVSDQKAPTYLEFDEQASAPAAAPSNAVRIYAEDNGSGKTRIVAKFATGAAIVIATQA